MRAIRCKECKSRFYSAIPADTCQNCAGTHNDFVNAQRDTENIRKVNKTHRTEKPQSVDPRTGLGAGETRNATPKNEKGSK